MQYSLTAPCGSNNLSPVRLRIMVLRNRAPGLLVVLALLFFLLTSCSRNNDPSTAHLKTGQQFVIGVLRSDTLLRQYACFQPVARYLSAQTGLDVRIQFIAPLHSIVNSFVSEKMDAAFFGSYAYVLAHERYGVQVIARPVARDGTSTYRGLLFSRRDSKIRSCKAMRGKSMVFVSRETYAGYLVPVVYFRRAGVEYDKFLDSWYFGGTHEAAILDVLNGKADIGAAKNTEFDRLAAETPRVNSQLIAFSRSPEVPENSLAVRKDLAPDVTELVRNTLLHMHETLAGMAALDAFGARRFIATSDGDFEPVYAYARAAGVEAGGVEKDVRP